MAPVYSSALALTSGTSRQADAPPDPDRQKSLPARASASPTILALVIPGTVAVACQAGSAHVPEIPPPPPPPSAPSFQIFSCGGWVAARVVVPPVDTTNGWLPGSSTESSGGTAAGPVSLQSSDPASPAAAKTVWP